MAFRIADLRFQIEGDPLPANLKSAIHNLKSWHSWDTTRRFVHLLSHSPWQQWQVGSFAWSAPS